MRRPLPQRVSRSGRVDLEEHLLDRISDGVELALEAIDEIVQSLMHDFIDIEELELGPQSSEKLLGAIAEIAG